MNCCIRLRRHTTPSPSKPMSRWAGWIRPSIFWPGATCRRELGQDPQIALFMPLLVGLDGAKKMSKSLGNYVGITESPDAMFGKLMSLSDAMMRDYFVLCTDVPL